MYVFSIFLLVMLSLFAIGIAYITYKFDEESKKYDEDVRQFMAFIEKAKYDHEHECDEGKHDDS